VDASRLQLGVHGAVYVESTCARFIPRSVCSSYIVIHRADYLLTSHDLQFWRCLKSYLFYVIVCVLMHLEEKLFCIKRESNPRRVEEAL
jgi:hypothetical protein